VRSEIALCAVLLLLPSFGAAQDLTYEGGLSVASGNYIFTERTTAWSWYNALALHGGPVTIRMTLPLYMQNTTLLAGTSVGAMPIGSGSRAAVHDSSAARGGQRGRGSSMTSMGVLDASGPVEVDQSALTGFRAAVGDPVVGVGLTLSSDARAIVSLDASIKPPLTDTTSFGTGEWDVGGAASISTVVSTLTLLSVSVSYWHLGDLPDLELQDPVSVSASIAHLWGGGVGSSLSGMYARSVVEGFEDAISIVAGVNRLWNRGALGLTGSIGLTETVPDFSIGLTWRIALWRG